MKGSLTLLVQKMTQYPLVRFIQPFYLRKEGVNILGSTVQVIPHVTEEIKKVY